MGTHSCLIPHDWSCNSDKTLQRCSGSGCGCGNGSGSSSGYRGNRETKGRCQEKEGKYKIAAGGTIQKKRAVKKNRKETGEEENLIEVAQEAAAAKKGQSQKHVTAMDAYV